ncbi:glycerophosphoryl diester phosphodiesterase membrane domain-containing protein [Arthrobacter sp. Sa2BUA2]|uniref:Glycerophosphoryl diester phosphodiesterase membrane domain-containing protein n=1 Tax=Arthrobacter pullicola TaxID=2762224 RepID=A0ABR8YI60_9MICC|nr:glycerophosphoryl diester phosphodiesterase membrane domain-containing protein [Arthrobacter pullicola]MBD8043812.1 glycerophosphoryl diester phosphodiesterase membrane domain-containing protein [Arthrobacter pullicola]
MRTTAPATDQPRQDGHYGPDSFRALVPGLLGAGWRTLRTGGWRLLALYAVSQAVLLMFFSPLIRWMFTEALSAAGMYAVDSAALASLLGNGGSIAWLTGLCLVAVLGVSLQLMLLVVAAARVRAGLGLHPAALARVLLPVLRRLLRPGSLPLAWYLFLVLPLAQAGFFSVLTHSIAVPNFISGELLKSTPGAVSYVIFLLVAGTLGIRFSLALPIFALARVTGGSSMRLSWCLTRRTDFALTAAGAAAAAAAFVCGAVLVAASLLPTLAADLAAPGLAAVTAAFALGAAQVGGIVIAGSFVMFLAAMLIELTVRSLPGLPKGLMLSCGTERDGTIAAGEGTDRTIPAAGPLPWAKAATGRSRRGPALVTAAVAVPALILGGLNIQLMEGLRQVPQTLVLAHRGFSNGGVENTVSGLKAAADAGADLVEMDVLQTVDGGFVVMHDASLSRLAGRGQSVKDLTLAELTAVTVHDQLGHQDTIPSLEEYIRAAQEFGEPLLIELKMHGGETADYVPRLVAELESLDALRENIYHSLDKDKAEELKRLRPGLYVGLTMAVAGVAAPDTTVDFIVVEEASYTDAVRESAWAKGMEIYVWTVNGTGSIRNMLRDNVDGIITDHPDAALRDRGAMGPGELMSTKLYDAVMRFVVIF